MKYLLLLTVLFASSAYADQAAIIQAQIDIVNAQKVVTSKQRVLQDLQGKASLDQRAKQDAQVAAQLKKLQEDLAKASQ